MKSSVVNDLVGVDASPVEHVLAVEPQLGLDLDHEPPLLAVEGDRILDGLRHVAHHRLVDVAHVLEHAREHELLHHRVLEHDEVGDLRAGREAQPELLVDIARALARDDGFQSVLVAELRECVEQQVPAGLDARRASALHPGDRRAGPRRHGRGFILPPGEAGGNDPRGEHQGDHGPGRSSVHPCPHANPPWGTGHGSRSWYVARRRRPEVHVCRNSPLFHDRRCHYP